MNPDLIWALTVGVPAGLGVAWGALAAVRKREASWRASLPPEPARPPLILSNDVFDVPPDSPHRLNLWDPSELEPEQRTALRAMGDRDAHRTAHKSASLSENPPTYRRPVEPGEWAKPALGEPMFASRRRGANRLQDPAGISCPVWPVATETDAVQSTPYVEPKAGEPFTPPHDPFAHGGIIGSDRYPVQNSAGPFYAPLSHAERVRIGDGFPPREEFGERSTVEPDWIRKARQRSQDAADRIARRALRGHDPDDAA